VIDIGAETVSMQDIAVRPAERADGGVCAERSSLMNVGRRVDYAIRALAYLAGQEPGRLVRRSEIEAQQGIPRHFLSKILRALVGAGFLESVAGARGGFRLRRSATEISFVDVYECFEGELCLIECLRDNGSVCHYTSVCTQIDVWRTARRKLFEYLGSVSIADVADGAGLECRLKSNGACTADRAR
jgi:Rrf2 family protein